MKQLIYLVLFIFVAIIVIRWYTSRSSAAAQGSAIKKLSAADTKAQLDADASIILLDVRTQAEFEEGHIPGATSLPNESISASSQLPYDKDARIFVYCRSGLRSAEAAAKLENLGYTDISNFGGIIDWPYEVVTE